MKNPINNFILSAFMLLSPVAAFAQPDSDKRQAPGDDSISTIARHVVEAAQAGETVFSPDRSWVLYTVSRESVAENHYSAELVLQRLAPDGGAAGPPVAIAKASLPRAVFRFEARWLPDGKSFTYFPQASAGSAAGQLLRYDPVANRAEPVLIRDTEEQATKEKRTLITKVGSGYRWSRDGSLIAFSAPLGAPKRPPLTKGYRYEGIDYAYNNALEIKPPRVTVGLFVLDVATGSIRRVTPATMSVRGFDWSPDSRALVVAGIPPDAPEEEPFHTDLFVIDASTGVVRDLVRQPGYDDNPSWSPDGKWIAIRTGFGKRRTGGAPALIPAAGGKIVKLVGEDPEDAEPFSGVDWAPDGRSFYFETGKRMSSALSRVDVAAAKVTRVKVYDGVGAIEDPRVAPDGRLVAYSRSSPTSPLELFVRPVNGGEEKQLTRLNEGFPLVGRVKTERIEWKSRDGATVYGLLLTPTSSRGPLPTLVYVTGGPSMIMATYDQPHPEKLSLAGRGYAVFIPNTRVLRGGYGDSNAFRGGAPDPIAWGRIPFEDVDAGVNELIKRGVADPQRLGILGHSWGGYWTSFAITQTHRFRAAVNYEGVSANMAVNYLQGQPKTGATQDFNKWMNVKNPHELAVQEKFFAASPGLNMHCVNTPTMLVFGTSGNSRRVRDMAGTLFSGLQYYGVPAELIMYEEGHVIMLPSAKVDLAERLGAWFDFWVRGLPYPDEKLGKEYDAWRKANDAKRSVPPPCAATESSPKP